MATQCNINKRDRASKRNMAGETNLIARYRRTRKGQILTEGGHSWGGEGKDGSDYYEIRLGSDGVLYCSCPDYRFRGHKANKANPGAQYVCKHVRAFLVHAAKMVAAGVAMDSECIIYNQAVTEVAIERLGEAAVSGAKMGRRVA